MSLNICIVFICRYFSTKRNIKFQITMEFVYYRYIIFILIGLLVFNDVAWRTIATLASIGGMLKKDCNDPTDDGEFCWSENEEAAFLGAFFYGYALQIIPTTIAAKIGFNLSHRISTFICGILQVTCPLYVTFSPVLGITLQGIRGLVSGVIMSNSFECARKWGLLGEANTLISVVGGMLFLASGVGPFIVSILTDTVGWRYAYYVSGAMYGVLLISMCLLMPDAPLQSWLMSEKEKALFVIKIRNEEEAAKTQGNAKYKVSFRSILGRLYVYVLCVFQIANLFLFYSDYIATPFYLNEFFDIDVESLGYLQLAMSLTAFFACFGWKLLLPFYDKWKISWFKSRLFMMTMPLIVNGLITALIPFVNKLSGVIACLMVKSIVVASLFGGSLMTVNYEIDPFNGPIIIGIFNSVGQAMGFVNPLAKAAMTHVDESRSDYSEALRTKWSHFFLMEAGIAFFAVLVVILSVIVRPKEWKKHQSLVASTDRPSTDNEDNRKVDNTNAGGV